LLDNIIESIQNKKGENVISLDLRNLLDAPAKFFVICDAESTTQVKAIADHVAEEARVKMNERPWHIEGLLHAQWILIDFVDIVVHIFLKPLRAFYQLEELWSDAIRETYD
jgi:ribosome-associated protein